MHVHEYVDHSSAEVAHMSALLNHIHTGVYENMVNCNFASIYVVIVITTDFICGIHITYTYMSVCLYVCMPIWMYI